MRIQTHLISLKTEYPNASSGKIHEMIWDMFRRTAIQTALTSSNLAKAMVIILIIPRICPSIKILSNHASEMALCSILLITASLEGI